MKTEIGSIEYKQTRYLPNMFQKKLMQKHGISSSNSNFVKGPKPVVAKKIFAPRNNSANKKLALPPVAPKVAVFQPKTTFTNFLKSSSNTASLRSISANRYQTHKVDSGSRNASTNSRMSTQSQEGFLKKGNGSANIYKKFTKITSEVPKIDSKNSLKTKAINAL